MIARGRSSTAAITPAARRAKTLKGFVPVVSFGCGAARRA